MDRNRLQKQIMICILPGKRKRGKSKTWEMRVPEGDE
jgi:hypothetical protein